MELEHIEKAVRSLYSDKENADIDLILDEIMEDKPKVSLTPTTE